MMQVDEKSHLDWDEFVDTYWDKRPVVYRALKQAPFVESDVIVAAASASQESFGAPHAAATLSLGGKRQPIHRKLLPAVVDESFARYDLRLREDMGAGVAEYALIVAVLHAFDWDLWLREARFIDELWQRVGLPITGAITTLFHGPYSSSPVGVHKDRFATFMFCLRGKKRMRFWGAKPWTHGQGTLKDYSGEMGTSFVVETQPGDFLYWPANYYHVGEGVEASQGVSATSVNIGVPRVEHRMQYDLESLLVDLRPSEVVGGRVADNPQFPRATGSMWAQVTASDKQGAMPVPDNLLSAVSRIAEAGVSERVHDASKRWWSSHGLTPVPPAMPQAAAPPQWLSWVSCRIQCDGFNGGTMVTANGHNFFSGLSPDIVRGALRSVNSTPDGVVAVSTLTNEENLGLMAALVQDLVSVHAAG